MATFARKPLLGVRFIAKPADMFLLSAWVISGNYVPFARACPEGLRVEGDFRAGISHLTYASTGGAICPVAMAPLMRASANGSLPGRRGRSLDLLGAYDAPLVPHTDKAVSRKRRFEGRAAKQRPSLRGGKRAGQLPGIDPDRKV